MTFRVDWVSADGAMFAVVAWSSDRTEAMSAYEALDDIPNSEGVFSAVTEESAIRAFNQGSGRDLESLVDEQTKTNRAYFMRMALPAVAQVAVNEEMTLAGVIEAAGY